MQQVRKVLYRYNEINDKLPSCFNVRLLREFSLHHKLLCLVLVEDTIIDLKGVFGAPALHGIKVKFCSALNLCIPLCLAVNYTRIACIA